jgi:hypothetical protein
MPRALPPELHHRLGKLLLLLSSAHDGERAAAAAAISRALQACGRDWHDLVGQLFTAPPPSPPPQQARRSQPDPDPDSDVQTVMTDDEVTRLVEAIFDSGVRLSSKSEEFLNSLADRAERYPTVFISPKQLKWLHDLAVAAKASFDGE